MSGVCYLYAKKDHLPLLLYGYMQVLNTVLLFKLKPVYNEHANIWKVLPSFNAFTLYSTSHLVIQTGRITKLIKAEKIS